VVNPLKNTLIVCLIAVYALAQNGPVSHVQLQFISENGETLVVEVDSSGNIIREQWVEFYSEPLTDENQKVISFDPVSTLFKSTGEAIVLTGELISETVRLFGEAISMLRKSVDDTSEALGITKEDREVNLHDHFPDAPDEVIDLADVALKAGTMLLPIGWQGRLACSVFLTLSKEQGERHQLITTE
jgi:hypothetical protein